MYSFNDWLEGKVILASSYMVYNLNEKPIIAPLADFSVEDQELIRTTLIDSFDNAVSNLLNEFKKAFQKENKATKDKDNLLNMSIGQCKEILLGKVPIYGPFATCSFWNVTFNVEVLTEISNHYKTHILRGKPIDYYSFQIQPSPLFEGEENPIVYSQTIWKFKAWLEKRKSAKIESKFDSVDTYIKDSEGEEINQKANLVTNKNSNVRVVISKEEQKLISDLILKNIQEIQYESRDEKYFDTSEKFSLVIELIKVFFVKNKGKYADLEFLFYKLKEKEVSVLNPFATQKKFELYLVPRFKLPSHFEKVETKFKKRKDANRELIFNLIFNGYPNLQVQQNQF